LSELYIRYLAHYITPTSEVTSQPHLHSTNRHLIVNSTHVAVRLFRLLVRPRWTQRCDVWFL